MTDRQKKQMLKIKGILEDIYYNGKLHGLTAAGAEILADCYNQIVKSSDHRTETISGNVAAVFRKAKFHVVDPHGCEVNYIISL